MADVAIAPVSVQDVVHLDELVLAGVALERQRLIPESFSLLVAVDRQDPFAREVVLVRSRHIEDLVAVTMDDDEVAVFRYVLPVLDDHLTEGLRIVEADRNVEPDISQHGLNGLDDFLRTGEHSLTGSKVDFHVDRHAVSFSLSQQGNSAIRVVGIGLKAGIVTCARRVADLRSDRGLTTKDGVNDRLSVDRQMEGLSHPDVREHRTMGVGTNEDRLHTRCNGAATQTSALL